MSQLTLETLEKLPAVEVKRRAELETVIGQDLRAFLRVGAALAEISNNRLYRSTHYSFEQYLAETWDLGRSTGYQLIDAHIVVEKLSAIADETPLLFVGKKTNEILLPQNEAQVRPLVKLKDDLKQLSRTWATAIDTAPNGKITAKHVQQTIFDIFGEKATDKTGKVRVAVNKDDQLSDDMKAAFESMLKEIERAKNSKYKSSSREAIIKQLDALREIVASDGAFIQDKLIITKTDRAKLVEEGFRILRANKEELCIEEQTGAGFWNHLLSCKDEEELSREFIAMMRDNSNLRG